MLNNKLLLSAVLATAVPLSAQASISVDGDIGDWDLGSDGWTPSAGSGISYVIDDYKSDGSRHKDSSSSSTQYINRNPGGGQAYDAEAIYLKLEASTLFVAIRTGLSPTDTSWKAGDIFFDLDGDAASTSYTNITNDGSTGSYAANNHTVTEATSGNGFEYGLVVVAHDDNSPYVDGNAWGEADLYNVDRWNLGGVYSEEDHPVSGNRGSYLNTNSVGYAGGSGEYVIEAAINLMDGTGNYNAFGQSLIDSIDNGTDINVHWNPLCNNDWIQFTGRLADGGSGSGSSINQVPEPAPLALLAIGFVGMAARKKYQKV